MTESTNHRDPHATHPLPPQDQPPKKSSSPLLLILLILAALALGWYFLSKREPAAPPLDPLTPIGETSGSTTGGTPQAADTPAAARQGERPTQRASTPANREARVLNQAQPEYPAVALRSRIEGTVVLRADIDTEGKPSNVTVVNSSRDRDLDRAAIRAVNDWEFEPAIRDGKPVAAVVEVPVDFRMESQ